MKSLLIASLIIALASAQGGVMETVDGPNQCPSDRSGTCAKMWLGTVAFPNHKPVIYSNGCFACKNQKTTEYFDLRFCPPKSVKLPCDSNTLCAILKDGNTKQYDNYCSLCDNANVKGYFNGPCPVF